jgi:hypothetical protein
MQHTPFSRYAILIPLGLLSACTTAGADKPLMGAASTWGARLTEPVSAPLTFESPVARTELRPVVVRHWFPNDSVFGGGSLDVLALQARYAINDRFAIIAVKDGYFDLQPEAGSDEQGFADIAAGVKYTFAQDADAGWLLTSGLVIEGTNGSGDVLQGNGDGVVRPFLSAGWDLSKWNTLANFGYNHPLDSDAESTSLDWHLHGSYELHEKFVPLAEINGIYYVKDGDALSVDFEGVDVINLGADDVSGNHIVTGALGFRVPLTRNLVFGLAYETALTSREDVFDERVTADLHVSF